jgi:hypothetical protein
MGRRSRGRTERAPREADEPRSGGSGRFGRRPRERRRRQRVEREAPGSVLGGPPIAVTCECGEQRDLRYGETWTCEQCGRRWDTSRIPREQYEVVRRTQLRFRILPVALGLLVTALAIFFTLTGNVFSVFLLLPVALSVWFVFLRPMHRRRYRAAIADLPRWELHPE